MITNDIDKFFHSKNKFEKELIKRIIKFLSEHAACAITVGDNIVNFGIPDDDHLYLMTTTTYGRNNVPIGSSIKMTFISELVVIGIKNKPNYYVVSSTMTEDEFTSVMQRLSDDIMVKRMKS